MSKPIHFQIIETARLLVQDEKKWCRSQMAFDSNGMAVCPTADAASMWCAYGALVAAAHHMTGNSGRAIDLAGMAVKYFGDCDALMRVNDTKGQAAVLALFDEVLERTYPSDLHLRADLDNAIGRYLEVGCGVLSAARKGHEQPVLPNGHLRPLRWAQIAAR